jgi:uncharacterized protein (TIGR03382 family)
MAALPKSLDGAKTGGPAPGKKAPQQAVESLPAPAFRLHNSPAAMALRAAIILLLLPALGLAQTVSSLPTGVNRDACTAGTKGIVITWNSSASLGDKVRLAAQSSCPATPPSAGTQGTLGPDIDWTGTRQSLSVVVKTIADATSVSCTGPNDTTVRLCVYLPSSQTPLVGSADFVFRTALPPAPARVTVSPANNALVVSITPGLKNDTDATVDSAAYQALVYDETNTSLQAQSDVVAKTSIRVGVSNGPEGCASTSTCPRYAVRARAFTSTDADTRNQSADTLAAGTFTPEPFDDVWTRYKAAGGREEGGCGTAGGGALSPLLLALALLRRRRS